MPSRASVCRSNWSSRSLCALVALVALVAWSVIAAPAVLHAQRLADLGPVGPTQRPPIDSAIARLNVRTQVQILGPEHVQRALGVSPRAPTTRSHFGAFGAGTRRVANGLLRVVGPGLAYPTEVWRAPNPSALSRDALHWHMGIESLKYPDVRP